MRKLLIAAVTVGVLLVATPTSASFTFVTSHHESLGVNGGTTSGLDTSAGDLIIASVGGYSLCSAISGFSDSNSNTWETITQENDSAICSTGYYCHTPCVTGSGHTFTLTSTSGFESISILVFSGAASGDPWNTQSSAAPITSATFQAGSITPASNNSLVVTGIGFEDNTSGAVSINGGFSTPVVEPQQAGTNEGSAISYLIQGSATAANPTWDITNSTPVAGWIVAFDAASGGAASSPRLLLLGVP